MDDRPGRRRIGAALLALALAGCRDGRPGADGADMPSAADRGRPTDGAAPAGDSRALGGMAIVLDLQWQGLGRQTQALAAGLGRLCDAPTADGLSRARQDWGLARRAWMEAQLYEIGPMTRPRLKAQLGWWPANPERIEALIGGDAALTPDFLSGQGSTVKGLYALEHLLWTTDGDDEALLRGLDAELDPAAARRCRYAAAAATAMVHSWTQADALWRSPRAAAAADGATTAKDPPADGSGVTSPLLRFETRQEALNAVVNRMVFVAQELDGMLARPLGRRTGGTPQPDAAQGTLSRSTVANVADGLCGLRALWSGDRSAHCTAPTADDQGEAAPFPALGELVRARSPQAADSIARSIAEAIAAVRAVEEPFVQTLAADPDRVEAAFQAVKALERSLATELVGALGVNLTFNANDGD